MATLYTSEQLKLWRRCARRPGGLSLRDVQRDPIATRALTDLMQEYTVAEEKIGLVLTKKTGNMQLFFYDLDDLHQWECVRNHRLVRENERLRVLLAKIRQQRESWKVRALMREAQLLETTTRRSDKGNGQNVTDLRYASLKRYLAKRFHPDFAPGQGIEKVVRGEIFKEVWNEIERLDQGGSGGPLRSAQPPAAAQSG